MTHVQIRRTERCPRIIRQIVPLTFLSPRRKKLLPRKWSPLTHTPCGSWIPFELCISSKQRALWGLRGMWQHHCLDHHKPSGAVSEMLSREILGQRRIKKWQFFCPSLFCMAWFITRKKKEGHFLCPDLNSMLQYLNSMLKPGKNEKEKKRRKVSEP